jgi:hypothetical protein
MPDPTIRDPLRPAAEPSPALDDLLSRINVERDRFDPARTVYGETRRPPDPESVLAAVRAMTDEQRRELAELLRGAGRSALLYTPQDGSWRPPLAGRPPGPHAPPVPARRIEVG